MFDQKKFDIWLQWSLHLAKHLWAEWAWQFLMNSSVLLHEHPKLRRAVVQAIHTICWEVHPSLQTDIFGKTYRSPTWLWPGILKEHMWALDLWNEFPFGFMVIGGITGRAQPGNPSPRIGRDEEQQSAWNAMWLPGPGIDAIVWQLRNLKLQKRLPDALWANLCNSLSSITDEDKIAEFGMMVEKIWKYIDVIELNFSCPNQHGVDGIQKSRQLLEAIIKKAKEANEQMALKFKKEKKAILIKIGPLRPDETYPENPNDDLSEEELRMIVETCVSCSVDWIVATNTAKNHLGLRANPWKWWMSGELLHDRSRRTLIWINQILGRDSHDPTLWNLDLTLIWAGGVWSGNSREKVEKTGTELLRAWADGQYMVTGFAMNPASIRFVNQSVEEMRTKN